MRIASVAVGVLIALLSSAALAWMGIDADRTVPEAAGAWTNVTSSPSPPAMAGAVMAYSSRDDRFVVFGGWNGTDLSGTWSFDPVSRTWSEISTHAPRARGDAAFAYDAWLNVFVLFGGWYEEPLGTYHRLSDTWHFYLANATWIPIEPPEAPAPRSDSAFAFDALHRVFVLFGGFNGASFLADTWYYSAGSERWTSVATAGSPGPRADGRIAYGQSSGEFYLFGGNDYSGPNFTFHHLNDSWKFQVDQSRWTAIDQSGGPSARDYAVLAFDTNSGNFLLLGGFGESTILGDLWAFNPSLERWSEVQPANPPEPRFAAVGGFDPVQNVFLIFGGLGNQGLLADTWLFSLSGGRGPPLLGVPGEFVGVGSAIAIGIAVAVVFRAYARRRSPRTQSLLHGSSRMFQVS